METIASVEASAIGPTIANATPPRTTLRPIPRLAVTVLKGPMLTLFQLSAVSFQLSAHSSQLTAVSSQSGIATVELRTHELLRTYRLVGFRRIRRVSGACSGSHWRNFKATAPILMSSPSANATGPRTRDLPRNVPFVLPRSERKTVPFVRSMSMRACRRETRGASSQT